MVLTTPEAWASGRPVFGRLPDDYRANQLTDTLTAHIDEQLTEVLTWAKNSKTIVDPVTAPVEWLDLLAVLAGWYPKYWVKGWSEQTKRCLLANSYGTDNRILTPRETVLGVQGGIWANKGTITVLQYVLDAIGLLTKVLTQGDFVIGTNEVGDVIGIAPWTIAIKVPASYPSSPRISEIELILKWFKPLYVKHLYLVDNQLFSVTDVLAVNTGEALGTDNDEALQGDTQLL